MANDKPRASFVFWQEVPDGKPFPMFNIFGNHKANGSTVAIPTLQRYGIRVPAFPDFFNWKLSQVRKELIHGKKI